MENLDIRREGRLQRWGLRMDHRGYIIKDRKGKASSETSSNAV